MYTAPDVATGVVMPRSNADVAEPRFGADFPLGPEFEATAELAVSLGDELVLLLEFGIQELCRRLDFDVDRCLIDVVSVKVRDVAVRLAFV